VKLADFGLSGPFRSPPAVVVQGSTKAQDICFWLKQPDKHEPTTTVT